jgi:hypothetical protein
MPKHNEDTELNISEDDVVVFLLPINRQKRLHELKTPKMPEGHRIHDAIERLGSATVKRVCEETGYSVDRVVDHIKHHMKLKRPKFEIRWRA